MKLKVDTSELTFVLALPPRPVRDYETKKVKLDENGVPLFSVTLLASDGVDAELIDVKVAGEPEGLTLNLPVAITGLTAQPWSMNGKFGVAFRALVIEPALIKARNGQAG